MEAKEVAWQNQRPVMEMMGTVAAHGLRQRPHLRQPRSLLRPRSPLRRPRGVSSTPWPPQGSRARVLMSPPLSPPPLSLLLLQVE